LSGVSGHALGAPKDDALRAAARSLGTEGVEAYQAGNYVVATDKLERAYQLLRAPSLGIWSGRALEKLGKLVQANERYLEVTRSTVTGGDAEVQRRAQQEAEAAQRELEPRIPTLTVLVQGVEAEQVSISLDGTPLPAALIGQHQPVDPGRHHLEGVHGDEHVSKDVTVAERGNAEAALVFHQSTSAAPTAAAQAPATAGPGNSALKTPDTATSTSWQRTAGYVGVGVGGAALIFGGVTAFLANGKHSDIRDNPACHDLVCPSSEQSLVDSYNTMRTLSSLGLIGGGIVAAAGVTLLLTAPKASSASASLVLAPNGVLLGGTY
jgi:hypothetical protein